MKLTQRIILITIIPLIVATSGSAIITTEIIDKELFDLAISNIKSLCQLTESEMRNPMNDLDVDKLNEIIDHLEKQEEVIQVLVLFPDGRLLTDGTDDDFNYGIILEDKFIQQSIKSNKELMIIENGIIRASKPITLNEKIGILVLDYSTNKINMSITNTISNIIIIASAIIIISGSIVYYLSRTISTPILQIRKNVEKIANQELENVKTNTNIPEINELASIIEELGSKIEKYQKELVKNERLSTIGEMSARVTHDLRNPLTTIKNSIEILKKKKPEMVKENQQYFDMMYDATMRINHQIDEVLGFIKIKEPEKNSVDFVEMIEKILKTIDLPKNIKLSIKPHKIWCDESQIQNVLINLISNAIHAIDKNKERLI